MNTHLLTTDADLQEIRALISSLGSRAFVSDFEESMQLESVRRTVKLWQDNQSLIAFAYVDDYNNLWFDANPDGLSTVLGGEIVAWGVEVMQERNSASNTHDTLDASCSADDTLHLPILLQNGFTETGTRTLKYERPLDYPLPQYPLPAGFLIRPVRTKEIDDLVALHRAAFGSDHMTVEERTAIINAPDYLPELDLVAVSADGQLAAFCICGIEEDDNGNKIGYTDPIGVHPDFQHLGLARALVSYGFAGLWEKGARVVKTGTGSDNLAMQRLASAMGFHLVEQKLWFARQV